MVAKKAPSRNVSRSFDGKTIFRDNELSEFTGSIEDLLKELVVRKLKYGPDTRIQFNNVNGVWLTLNER